MGLSVERKASGEPRCYVRGGMLSMAVREASSGEEYWMVVPLKKGLFTACDLELRVATTERVKWLATSRLMSHAMPLELPDGDEMYRMSVLLQQRCTPIDEFIAGCVIRRRLMPMRRAMEGLAEAIVAFTYEGLVHGAITVEALQFSELGELRLADYAIATRMSGSCSRGDVLQLADSLLRLYVAASDVGAWRILRRRSVSGAERERRLRCIASVAEYYHLMPLLRLVRLIMAEADGVEMVEAAEMLAAAPFESMPLLVSLLERGGTESKILFDNGPERVPLRVDFAECERVVYSDQPICRYCMDGHWGYATLEGECIDVGRVLLAAFDFSEGRAVVRTSRGYGLIDSSGGWIMRDEWDDMSWFGREGVATACDSYGHWHIYGPTGRQLSTVAADWMGDVFEGYVVASKGRKYGYYDVAGRQVCDFMYDQAQSFSNGVARVKLHGEWYHIDRSFHRLSAKRESEL